MNALTKKKKNNQAEIELEFTEVLNEKAGQEAIEKSWENTVINKILHRDHKKDRENKNILLEFTATVPEDASVVEKYQDKTIYQFGLKEFLKAGYTKEINIISSTLEKKERVLQVLILNWYKSKIALSCVPNFKPVILFRSKTIDDSKNDFSEFLDWVNNLKTSDFDFLKDIE